MTIESVLGELNLVTFRGVNNKGGRGIVVDDEILKVTIIDNCLAVCCREFAVWLMQYRQKYRKERTVNQAFKQRKGNLGGMRKLLGHPMKKRDSNRIALPPFVV